MTADRWERVRALFQAALDQPADERASYLRSETNGDEEICREVESLLAALPEAQGFLSEPAIELANSSEVRRPRLSPGTRVGPFEILARLGVGGMGEVYRARDTRLDRAVAIKVLAPNLASDPQGRERFEREARLISMLTHPHICTLYDVGSVTVNDGELQYLVMELLTGETLASRLRRSGALPIAEALNVGGEILDALVAAHAQGIVHRDLKPGNIVLTVSGVKLLDFGLARFRPAAAPDRQARSASAGDPLTFDGAIVGTLPYMAPEQVRGEHADMRSDLFAFGSVMYEMLTGRRPFEADSQAELAAAILEREPPPIAVRQPLVPPMLDRLVAMCLAKDRAERWQHAHDVAIELKSIAEGTSVRAMNSRRVVVGLHHGHHRWRIHGAWATALIILGLALWSLRPTATAAMSPVNPTPVVVLMDSPLEGRVYDRRTLAAGGSNADDITDILREVPVLTYKENTSPMWHREEQVRQANPDLIISHLSCLFDVRMAKGDAELNKYLFDLSEHRLTQFFGYLGAVNSRTRFLVYSRGRYVSKEAEAAWAASIVTRYPHLEGRLFAMMIPGGEAASFRDPEAGKLVRARVQEILALERR